MAEPYNCQSMKQSINENKLVYIDTSDTFVDGATVNQVEKILLKFVKNLDNIWYC